MSLTARGFLTQFDADGAVVGFAVFNEPPVSSTREPDDVYTRTENGWTSGTGIELSTDDLAELDALVTPPAPPPDPDAPPPTP